MLSTMTAPAAGWRSPNRKYVASANGAQCRAFCARRGGVADAPELEVRLDRRVRHQALFDAIGHGLLLRAVREHCEVLQVLLYVERWLKAPTECVADPSYPW